MCHNDRVPTPNPNVSSPLADRDLVVLLSQALRLLGQAGRPVEASQIAGKAWWATRANGDEKGAARINGVMHYLAKLPPNPVGKPRDPQGGIMSDQKLDVRTEIPMRRHELIFETYHELAGGQGFELVNDHDPKPLYYQFAAEHAGEFTWDYLEEGPEVWRVRIGKPEDSTQN